MLLQTHLALDRLLADALVRRRMDEEADDDGNGDELTFRQKLIRRKRPDEPMGLVERGLRAGIRTVPRTLGGVAQLGGTGLEALGVPGGEQLRGAGEALSERVRAERERRGLPETPAEHVADLAGTLVGEGAQLLVPGGAGARLGSKVPGLGRAAPRVARAAGAAAGSAPVLGAIGAGTTPEESTLGAAAQLTGSEQLSELAQDPVARASTEAGAAALTGGALIGAQRAGAPVVRAAGRQMSKLDFDRVMLAYRATKLWDPLARMRDLLGDNVVMATLEAAKDVPAYAADSFIEGMGKLTGRAARLGGRVEGLGGVLPGGVRQQLRGLGEGARDLAQEFRPENLRRLPTEGRYVEGGVPGGAEVSLYESLPFKMAAASDQLGRPIASNRVAYNMARAQAVREGRKGAARKARVEELLANPTDEMVLNMGRQSEMAVFMGTNRLTEAWRDFTADGKMRYLQTIEPFTRSAINVAERSFDYSPLSLARVTKRAIDFARQVQRNPGVTEAEQGVLREARRRVTEQAGRFATGTPLILTGWALKDQINPWYERGTREQRRRRQAGEPSAAIRAGNAWVPLSRNFGPGGNQVLIGAQLRELAEQEAEAAGEDIDNWSLADHQRMLQDAIERDGPDLVDLLKVSMSQQGVLTVAQAMTELAPGANLYDYYTAARRGAEGGEFFEREAGRQVGSGPVPSILARTARATDPYQREASTVGEQLMGQLPGASRLLEPRLDAFGEPVRRPRTGIQALDPFQTSTDRLSDPLLAELDEVGFLVPTPTQDRERGESDEDFRIRAQEYGRAYKETVERTILSPEYMRALSEDDRRQILERNVGRRRNELNAEWREFEERLNPFRGR